MYLCVRLYFITASFFGIWEGLSGSAYLHVVGSWDVGCSFEGVRHISQDLRGKEKVATVVAPPLQELQETPYDLRHALPSQGPLTLREMLS